MGRRDENKFGKVTAVSSTGFSPGALSLAKKESIDLHIVEHLTSDDIISWWGQTNMTLLELSGIQNNAEIIFTQDTKIELLQSLKEKLQDIKPDQKFLISSKDSSPHSLAEAWKKALNLCPQMFEGLQPNGEERQIILEANYRNPEDRYQVFIHDELADIIQIKFHAKLKIIEHTAPINRILQISDPINNKTIDQLVDYHFKILDQNLELSIHRFEDSKDIVFGVRSDKASE